MHNDNLLAGNAVLSLGGAALFRILSTKDYSHGSEKAIKRIATQH